MLELKGKYAKALVYTDNIEQEAISQIIELCNQPMADGSTIAIMPDTHAGKGCTIGTTMTINGKVCPNLVGVDIGCGMEVIKIAQKDVDFAKLDKTIRDHVPSGFNTREKEHKYVSQVKLDDLICKKNISMERAKLSVGTLGGGNHFLEMNQDEEGNIYLVVHSGSRNLGKQVAEYYQELAYERLTNIEEQKKEVINKLKSEGRVKDIQSEIKKITPPKISKALAYLEGQDYLDYLHDMQIVQQFAVMNRKAMVDEIVNRMGFTVVDQFTTIHNYIELESSILRKGAISAKAGEKVIIPINMRDGSIIAIGKGNPEWNYSACHGAGRLMSRSKAKEKVSLEEYEESMKGIWTTSVNKNTIDESPMAYKPMDEIMENIKDTVEIISVIKPLYNFKASEI